METLRGEVHPFALLVLFQKQNRLAQLLLYCGERRLQPSSTSRANAMIKQKRTSILEEIRLSPTLLLLSDDEALADLVRGIVKRPWKLVRQGANGFMNREAFSQPNVRLVILDDQAIEENDRGWLLAQIRKHLPGPSLLYVAANQSDGNEKRARTTGAHYYVSKPLSLERFGNVLRSFLKVEQVKGQPNASKKRPTRSAKKPPETRIASSCPS